MKPDEKIIPQEQVIDQENLKQEQVEGTEPSKEETEVNPDDAKLLRSE